MTTPQDALFDRLITQILGLEGDYSDHSADRGGKTRFGITQATARAAGYSGPMRSLPRATALAIYRQTYWLKPGFAALAPTSPALAAWLLDTGINMGPGTATSLLQRLLSLLSAPPLRVDGQLGPRTLAALAAYLKRRGSEGEAVLLRALTALKGARYITLAEQDPTQQAFLYGWLRTRLIPISLA